MDERLIAADPREVMRRMAEAYLAAPAITAELGGIRLAPHQVDAASRLLALLGEWGGAVLADATGLGKTFVAIAVARVTGPTLVIAPAALRNMWKESLTRAGVVAAVESYERLSRGDYAVAERPALLVLDEAHHARNPRARRYAALADLAWGTKVLLLTATPIHNRGRDLQALIALFMGSRADAMSEVEIGRFMVRRTSASFGGSALPDIGDPEWLAVPCDHDTLRAIRQLPPAVPATDGGAAHALMVLGLIRAWSSSEAALRATLRRRLRRAASFAVVLESGRLPDRRELATWPVVDDAIQLGFPELHRGENPTIDVVRVREALDRHCEGVRSILRTLDPLEGAPDSARIRHLASIRGRHPSIPIVAFTQFAETASAAFRACAQQGGVALVSGRGARIAAGRVTAEEIVRGFDVSTVGSISPTAMPLELLIATDVLSEGLSLRRAGVIVHLDLPWTVARLEQRIGRTRRIGSTHRCIAVYAIGPPVESRELVPVVRALQRKARLVSRVVGREELQSSLPLLGGRLKQATLEIARRGEHGAIEELRSLLTFWAAGTAGRSPARPQPGGSKHFVAIALVVRPEGQQLVAVTDGRVSDSTTDVLRTVRALSACVPVETSSGAAPSRHVQSIVALIDEWLDEQRGRELARPVSDAASEAHGSLLRKLQEILARAPRTERTALAARIERCRQLVMSARGIGAEMAMGRIAGGTLDIQSLERLLASRAGGTSPTFGSARLEAMIFFDPDHDCRVSAMSLPSPE